MADPRPLTREELSKFLPNQRAIRAFEKLFDLIPSDLERLEALIEESSIDANTGVSKANQAIGGVDSNEIKSKSNGVLTWLSM